jgi:rhodanese-related sulfurtransferase
MLKVILSSKSKLKVVMKNLQEILHKAASRAAEHHLPYAGALTPNEAYEILLHDTNAALVDVRTQAELDLVGRIPDALNIEWAFYPGMVPNPDFGQQLKQQLKSDQTIIFLCRTGGRSHNAAAVAASLGYGKAYNMLEGFEGEANALQQRTTINGWKHADLPWTHAKV